MLKRDIDSSFPVKDEIITLWQTCLWKYIVKHVKHFCVIFEENGIVNCLNPDFSNVNKNKLQ